MSFAPVLLALPIALAAFLAWQLVLAIKSRRVEIGDRAFDRAQQPALYWGLVSIDFLVVLAVCAWAASALLGMFSI
jgi:hypothetical protein